MSQKKLMLLGGIRYLLPAIEMAHRLGYYVITVDYLPHNIAHQYSDEYHNISILDKDAVLSLAQGLKIDGILSFAVDPGVLTAAYVAEKMNLPSTVSFESACVMQDKSKFRRFLSDNGFNVPRAKGYSDVYESLKDMDTFNWPVIVKPVDSAGSKGVTRVERPKDLLRAIRKAVKESNSRCYIIEEYIELQGYQSSADCFSVDGELVYVDFSDQLFDSKAPNPFTPSIEVWPSSMSKEHQNYLRGEIQRLFKLLNCRTGIYNIESRIGKNGTPYIMEVSPRAGGNRIAELQRIGSGIDLIEAEVCKAVGDRVKDITMPHYNGYYVNYIVHSNSEGYLKQLIVDDDFRKRHVLDYDIRVNKGDHVNAFLNASNALGTLFLHFNTKEQMDRALSRQDDWVKMIVK